MYYQNIWAEFNSEKNMVFISGPRQTGKTTLAKSIAAPEPSSLYFNYDIQANKARLLENPTFFEEEVDRKKNSLPLIVLDEIHKHRDWKNYLKGIYDGYADEFRFLVTGSGRLDLSRRKGDSLAGRYLHFHLHPFTLGEMFASGTGLEDVSRILEIPERIRDAEEAWETMFHMSGFPEPFLKGSKTAYRRWARTYHSQVIRDDIRDEFAVRQMDAMETLYAMLSRCVGSPFSASSLARTLGVSHKTVSSWIDLFERFFLVFKIRPFSRRLARSLVKEPKIYFYDYCRTQDEGLRFENMVAVELHRATTLWKDFGLGDYDLWHIRNKEKQEVDFLVTENKEPRFMVETKLTETRTNPNLIKFQNILNVPAVQLVNRKNTARKIKNGSNSILVAGAANWLSALN